MSLISCPSCNNDVSTKAESCPKCGHPINERKIVINNNTHKSSGGEGCLSFIGAVVVLIILISLG